MATTPLVRVILTAVYIISLYFVVFWFLVFIDKAIKPHKKRAFKEWPLVTIGIPAYNEAKKESSEGLRASIQSILDLDYPKDRLDIIAVNHGSTDDTGKVLNEFKDRIRVVTIGRTDNDMKGVAMNKAIELAKGEFFVTFDADSLIDKDALKKLLPYFSKKSIGAVLPMIKVWKTRGILQKLQWYEFLVNGFYKKIMGKINCVHCCPGPFSIYRTHVLSDLGGFDPYDLADDFEMTLRVHKAHYEIVQTTDCFVYSNLPGTPKPMYNQRNRWFLGTLRTISRHRDMLFNKKYGDFGFIQLPMIIASALLAISILSVTLYHLIKNSSTIIKYLSSIGFDIWTLISGFTLNFVVWDLNFVNLMIGAVMLSITIFFLVLAHRHAKESMRKHSFASLVLFFLCFFFVLGISWSGAVFDFLRGKKRTWRNS